MDPAATVRLGQTDVAVTRLGLGGGPLASAADAPTAAALIARAYERGIGYFDTAPLYGRGVSEERYGAAVPGLAGPITLSTKVGRVLDQDQTGVGRAIPAARHLLSHDPSWRFDFSRDGVLRSLEGSRRRLGRERFDIVLIHDPDDHEREALAGALPTLIELREQGLVGAIGAGMNQWEMELRFAREGGFDCFLLAGRYTLLEQGALDEFLPYCEANAISVIAGGPYNSGILASDLSERALYNYDPAPAEVLTKARAIAAVCERHGVPLKAAALQFILAHPAIAAIIPGAASPAEVDENADMVAVPIPTVLWDELKHERLIAEEAPIPVE